MKNPINDKKGSSRVFRGGGWLDWDVRVLPRYSIAPTRRLSDLGFRIVRNKQ